jgi:hypothetical protein
LLQGKIFQDQKIERFNLCCADAHFFGTANYGNGVASFNNIVDFLRQITLRWWEFKFALNVLEHLLFGKRIAFNRGCRQDAFCEIQLMEVFGYVGSQRNPGDVLAL